jgi:SagB-type dehydrogenase family enzyme
MKSRGAPPPGAASPVERAVAYHIRTKHHLNRYAASSGYLDWATQPDPFRTFEGAPRVDLPLVADRVAPSFRDLYRPSAIAPRPLSRESIAALFELSLGLSAWKQLNRARWALRCNPSSGNLHPTEGYLIMPSAAAPVSGVPAGVYHYVSRDHALERRAALDEASARALAGLLPPDAVLIGLSSVHWREAWKYGERAFRYCQHDVGHAIAAVRYAAAAIGYRAVLLEDLGDADVAALLGLSREDAFLGVDALDREHPDAILLVMPASAGLNESSASAAAAAFVSSVDEAIRIVRAGAWAGRANPLSPGHQDWEVIAEAAEATWKERATAPSRPPAHIQPDLPPRSGEGGGALASEIIRKRRSAVDFDGRTGITAETLYSMLDHLLPRPGVPPWDAIPWEPCVHPVLFVHRVCGLPAGLYAFERSGAVHERLRAGMDHPFDWERPAGCPDHLRLYRLAEADLRDPAQVVSCHQSIASDGAFSLGMVADFTEALAARGAPFYRRLFWESGILGHVLYLEAEARAGEGGPIRATGIGCYFDDAFHDLCGISGTSLQSLYHFTVGGPVEDTRLTTAPPYEHLGPEASTR